MNFSLQSQVRSKFVCFEPHFSFIGWSWTSRIRKYVMGPLRYRNGEILSLKFIKGVIHFISSEKSQDLILKLVSKAESRHFLLSHALNNKNFNHKGPHDLSEDQKWDFFGLKSKNWRWFCVNLRNFDWSSKCFESRHGSVTSRQLFLSRSDQKLTLVFN